MLLAVAVASYEQWLADTSADLQRLIDDGFRELAAGMPTIT